MDSFQKNSSEDVIWALKEFYEHFPLNKWLNWEINRQILRNRTTIIICSFVHLMHYFKSNPKSKWRTETGESTTCVSVSSIPSGSMSCKAYHIPWLGLSTISERQWQQRRISINRAMPPDYNVFVIIWLTCHLEFRELFHRPTMFLQREGVRLRDGSTPTASLNVAVWIHPSGCLPALHVYKLPFVCSVYIEIVYMSNKKHNMPRKCLATFPLGSTLVE